MRGCVQCVCVCSVYNKGILGNRYRIDGCQEHAKREVTQVRCPCHNSITCGDMPRGEEKRQAPRSAAFGLYRHHFLSLLTEASAAQKSRRPPASSPGVMLSPFYADTASTVSAARFALC